MALMLQPTDVIVQLRMTEKRLVRANPPKRTALSFFNLHPSKLNTASLFDPCKKYAPTRARLPVEKKVKVRRASVVVKGCETHVARVQLSAESRYTVHVNLIFSDLQIM